MNLFFSFYFRDFPKSFHICILIWPLEKLWDWKRKCKHPHLLVRKLCLWQSSDWLVQQHVTCGTSCKQASLVFWPVLFVLSTHHAWRRSGLWRWGASWQTGTHKSMPGTYESLSSSSIENVCWMNKWWISCCMLNINSRLVQTKQKKARYLISLGSRPVVQMHNWDPWHKPAGHS